MFAIVRSAIDVDALVAQVCDEAHGGLVTFCGLVRSTSSDGLAVLGLSYEAHEDLAIAEFEQIAREAQERFGPCRIGVAHRIGDLEIGEVAVAVVVAAPHRTEAFDVCEYVIDELKARAPIWKKEHYTGGSSEWIENDCGSSAHPR